MRDKESVTQIFILYGYEKEGDHVFMTHPLFILPQASNVMPGGESGASRPKFPY